MKQYKKRFGALLSAAMLLCAAAGCGGGSAVQVMEDPLVQPEYLSFFSSSSMSDSDVIKYWTERFTEQYNQQVYINCDSATYYADAGLSYRELMEKRFESSAPDDLYIIKAEDVLEFEKRGYWMDLSDMDFVDNLSEAALYQSTYNGKVFSVPLSFTGFGFLWNTDMLAAHDLTIPQNLEEFLHVCETLKNDGILPYGANKGFALTVPAMCAGLSSLYGNADNETDIAALNSGEMRISRYLRGGYELLALMIESGYLDPQQALETTTYEGEVDMFFAGECAFICVALGEYYNWDELPFEIELTGVPVLPDGCAAVYGAGKRLCVNPQSKHLDTALQFVEMVGTSESLTESALMMHAMSSAKEQEMTAYTASEMLVELLRQPGQIPNQDFALHFNTWESIRDVARELCGGASVNEACDMLDEKQREDLAAYGDSQ